MSFAYINGLQYYSGGVGASRFETASFWVCANQANLSSIVDDLENKPSPGESQPVQGLFLRGMFSDLSPLRRITFPVANLRLEDHTIRKCDLEDIYCLNHLGGLSLAATECGLDFSEFPNLGQFVGDWHANHTNLSKCRHLRAIRLFSLNIKSNNIRSLGDGLPLEDLSIVRTNIDTLDGVGGFDQLLSLSISYAPKLRDIAPLATLQKTLEELEFDHARKVENYGALRFLRKLKQLKIVDGSEISSLELLSSLDKLETLSIAGTNVADGNFDFLLKLPCLRAVGFDDKKHYTQRSDALNRMLQIRQPLDFPL